jgi:probable phosphoglycerate mutase
VTGPLYLLRHGQTEWNREGRLQGGRDSALTALGRVQSARQGALLRAAGVSAPARVSPRGRARRSAALAGLMAEPDPDLAELALGDWEGTVRPARPGVTWKFDAPGGETAEAFAARLARVLARPGPLVVVTHGVVVIGLRAMVLGLALRDWDRLDDPQGVVHVLRDGPERRMG